MQLIDENLVLILWHIVSFRKDFLNTYRENSILLWLFLKLVIQLQYVDLEHRPIT